MLDDPDIVAAGLRNTELEKKLVKELRASDPDKADAFLVALLGHKSLSAQMAALDLVTQCVQDKKRLRKFLRMGLERKDLSGVKYWFRALIPKVGIRHTLWIIRSYLQDQPDVVACCLYHLTGEIQDRDPEKLDEVFALRQDTEERIRELPANEQEPWLRMVVPRQ